MRVELTKEEFNSNFNKLLTGLIEGNEVDYFSVDKERKVVNILVGNFGIELRNDGTWEIG